MSTVAYPHITTSPDGQLRVGDSGVKLIMLVMQHLAYRWDAEDLQRQYPQLSLGQTHAALAYYYDHEQEINAMIVARSEHEDSLLQNRDDAALRAKLLAAKGTR